MGLILKFIACPDSLCEKVVITDKTGQYSSLNQGGFGTPNIDVADVTTAIVAVSKRASDGTFAANTNVDVYNTLPSDSGGTFDIDNTLYAGGFPDGIYRFIYTITGIASSIPFTYSATVYRPIVCSLVACWQKLGVKMSECPTPDLMDKQRRVSVLMRALDGSCDCGDLNEMQEIIDEITNLCKQCGCNCGC